MARFGIITYDFFPLIGGIGRHTYLMFSKLTDKDLLFFSPSDNSLPRHFRISSLFVRFFKQVGVSIWLHCNVFRIISEYHLEKLNLHSGPGGVFLVRRLPIPVIVTCHHTYRQQLHYIRSQFWKLIFLPYERRTYQLATKIVCVSDATRRALIDYYDIPEEKIFTVYNAVDTNQFYPLGIDKNPHSIVYVGRIDKRKGIEFLIRSMSIVCREIPDAHLFVGGKGSHLKKMKSLVSRLKLENNVTFLGFVPDEQLNTLYNQAQCVVVPSIFEGFGISVIEALAAGTRVVGTDVDGIREILQNKEYGRLAPYGDLPALADAIVTELREPQRAGKLSQKYHADQFGSCYMEVLNEN